MKMFTFLDLKSIGADGQPLGVAVVVASNEKDAIQVAMNECTFWRPEDTDALRDELSGKTPVTCDLPTAFLSSTGCG